MLKIRLQRFGKKNRPHYRVVLIDSKMGPRSGNYIESLGWYNPVDGSYELKKEEIRARIKEGAHPSGTVHNLLVKEGVIDGGKVSVTPRTKGAKKSEEGGAEAGAVKEKDVEVETKNESEQVVPESGADDVAKTETDTDEETKKEKTETEESSPKAKDSEGKEGEKQEKSPEENHKANE